jgi:hypothetical protein
MYEGRTDKLGRGVLVLVGLLHPLVPLFVQIFTRTVEKYYDVMATTSRSVENYQYAFTPSFGSMYEGRTDILGRGALVLVGLLHPLVPIFVRIFTRTVEKYYATATTSRSWGNYHMHLHHPLEVCMKEEQIYLGEGCWSWLGCCSLWFQYLSRSSLEL